MKKISTLKNFFFIILTIFTFTIIDFFGFFQKFEYRFFDLLLSAKKNTKEAPEILLVEADNISLEHIGPWPWKRDVYANLLIRMKELGAKTAVFDIEFLSPSNFPECDEYFARSIQFFENAFLTINTSDLDIQYTPEELQYVADRFLIKPLGKIDSIIEGNNITRYEVQKNTLFGFNKFDWDSQDTKHIFSIGFSPAKNQFISKAKGAGFTNIIIDKDGTRRRVELLNYQKNYEKAVGQLIFAPLLNITNPEKIIHNKNSLELVNATINNKKTNIKIPLDSHGRMIVNWTKNKYEKAFRHESIMFIDMLEKIETNIFSILQNIVFTLQSLSELQIEPLNQLNSEFSKILLDYETIVQYKEYLLSLCEGFDNESNAINGGIPNGELESYFSLRKDFFINLQNYSNSSELNSINKILSENIKKIGEENIGILNAQLGELCDVLKHEIALYNDTFNEKSSIYKDSFCIIGNNASSTTDLGTTPFERAFPNMGTHANVYNTIVNQDFIIPLNQYFGIILISILLLLQEFFTRKSRVLVKNITGISVIIFALLFPFILIRLFGIYIQAFTPILISFISYLVLTLYRFIIADKDKKFLQTTFGAYVAPAIVDQIVKNPELANLGGKSENLTALFSDVKTFSGFTEVINNEEGEEKGAERLVEILNQYLGDLSNAIMNNNGTIDKYVGDEIVSFFGAPVQTKNNAFDACIASIRMLQAEQIFNEKFKDILPINPKTGEPFYLRSRIGLNTGTMVVGNMGTEKKLNYTIMGNNVNLASRLEGINKIYGSWIICSETTWKKANSDENKGKLIARKLDKVRVINVNKPVGIYNILGLKDELPKEQIEAANIFNKGIELYLKGSDTPEVPKSTDELNQALKYFIEAYKLYPQDESSKVFIKRCTNYIKNGVPKFWDGVYTMETK